ARRPAERGGPRARNQRRIGAAGARSGTEAGVARTVHAQVERLEGMTPHSTTVHHVVERTLAESRSPRLPPDFHREYPIEIRPAEEVPVDRQMLRAMRP